jgi:hypothetical protein
LLSGRNLTLYVAAGIAVGFFMIWAHIGPGVNPLPTPNTPQNRNLWRQADINQIGQALVSYYHDNNSIPYTIPTQLTQICTDMGTPCSIKHFVDISYLMTEGDYLPGVPEDPGPTGVKWGSGFDIASLGSNEIKITAPDAEQGKVISATFQL